MCCVVPDSQETAGSWYRRNKARSPRLGNPDDAQRGISRSSKAWLTRIGKVYTRLTRLAKLNFLAIPHHGRLDESIEISRTIVCQVEYQDTVSSFQKNHHDHHNRGPSSPGLQLETQSRSIPELTLSQDRCFGNHLQSTASHK